MELHIKDCEFASQCMEVFLCIRTFSKPLTPNLVAWLRNAMVRIFEPVDKSQDYTTVVKDPPSCERKAKFWVSDAYGTLQLTSYP